MIVFGPGVIAVKSTYEQNAAQFITNTPLPLFENMITSLSKTVNASLDKGRALYYNIDIRYRKTIFGRCGDA
jgi:hypothetical protein